MIGKKLKSLIVVLGFSLLNSTLALAQDITAVDFTGEVIGKVIPDGTAINLKNEIMGQLTADSLIINSKGQILGGVVPQGFAVSNDHKYLGKVSSDGTVRLPSGKIAGKVLPNGLVVDDFYDVVGSVLSSGIVYNDAGQPIGRLAGNGSYINFDGQNIGFVSPSGYAYRQADNNYVLEGKLISSKMVVSLEGAFIGSVAPGGQVTDFDGAMIGRVHANGYVYDGSANIIGRTVKTAYAFDNSGAYLGLVSYDGDVVFNGKSVGKQRADGKIVNLKGEVVGFHVELNAVAVSSEGKYLGYLAPNGQILKNKGEVVGFVGPRKTIKNKSGEVIGQIADKGPVFDYLGRVRAEAMPNGQVVSFEGSALGFMKGSVAFDNAGFMLGAIMEPALILDANQNVIGLTGVGSEFLYGAQKYVVSPLGYVFSADGVMVGETVGFASAYQEDGSLFGYVDVNGKVKAPEGETLRVKSSGFIADAQNQIKARQIRPSYALMYGSSDVALVSDTNEVYDTQNKVLARVLPEYDLVSAQNENMTMPVIGEAGEGDGFASSVRGELIGYADMSGRVFGAGKEVGKMNAGDVVLNRKGVYLGQNLPFGAIVNSNCENLGVVGVKGDARSGRDNVLGKVLINGQVVSEVGQYLGYKAQSAPVYDFEGKVIGFSNATGKVIDDQRQVVGCLNWDGRMYEDGAVFKGAKVNEGSVMNFESMFIGRVNVKNEFVNNDGDIAGFAKPDGTVVNENNRKFGLVFKYKVAFDKNNNFVGYVSPDGKVLNDQNKVFGYVTYDGLVVSKNKAVGYALYDLYVYDEFGHVMGYLMKNGSVMSFSGVNLGKADRGFLVSKEGVLIGRGNRDYFIRDKKNEVIGELKLSGKVYDVNGEEIADVSGNGDVRDQTGKLLAVARPLQYYAAQYKSGAGLSVPQTEQESPFKVGVIDQPEYEDEEEIEDDMPSYRQKVIGVVFSPDGKYLGHALETGEIVSDSGDVVGRAQDGLAFDEDNNLIGTVDEKQEEDESSSKPKPAQAQVPSTMFLPNDAYGTSDVPSDLGPGGGFGPNERYDPVRARMLAEAQAVRQSEIKVGKLTSNVNPSSVTGWQSNWDNANFAMSSWRVDMSEMILADKPIPAVLARTIMDSGLAGSVPITAIVERNVYAEDGRNIVIPAGSRVMGQSSGGSTGGSTGSAVRMDITWTRLIRPDGSAFEFSQAQTGDAQGRGGALGYLDQQLLKKYTLPMATSLMSDALAYVMARGQTTTSSDGASTQDSRSQAAEDARQHFLDNMDEIFRDIMNDKMNIAAVTYIPAGTRLIIYPKVDLWLRTAEREKEQENSMNVLSKPESLIDDRDPVGTAQGHPVGSSNSSSSGGGSSSRVVYSGDDNSVQPTSAPLIDDGAYEPKRRRTVAPGVTPPPPSTNANVQTSSNSSSDNSSGALF